VGIVAEDVQRVKLHAPLSEVVQQHVALRRVGARLAGLCPFHAEKTPSFYVNDELGVYRCFGCGASGDAISFVREIEHLDFVGAVEWLARRAGIELRYDDAGESKERQRRARLVEVVRRAVDWYHQRLLTAPDAGAARAYLRSRGIDGDTVRAYQLGWAPDEWDALAKALRVPDEVLRDTGLGFVNRRGRQQDAFRARVLFPIFDVQGDPVAFGGRLLPGAEGPKYKNSAEGPLYAKSRTLYGLHWAKAAIVHAGEVVVCEGYTDVIGFATAGVPRAVATCGTALTEDHFRVLKSYARRVVLAFDADAAGQAAAARFYEWEQRFDLDVRVAALPGGADPGELAQRDQEGLRAAVADARPFLAFRLERVLGHAGLDTPEARARAADAALAVIAEHPRPTVRDQYVMEVADRCRVAPDVLRRQLEAVRAGRPVRTEVVRRAPATRDTAETTALWLLLHRWDDVAPYLDARLFTDPVHLEAFRALAASESFHVALEQVSGDGRALLERLAVEDKRIEDPEGEAARLVGEVARRTLAERLRAADGEGGTGPEVLVTAAWVRTQIEALGDASCRREALGQLLRWVSEPGGAEGP